MADSQAPPPLTKEQEEHFLEHGWVKVTGCFTREQANEKMSDMWTRLGFDPNDMSTWTKERTNMHYQNTFPVSEFAPKAWAAVEHLLGGAERVDPAASTWKDSFIVNPGTPAGHNKVIKPQQLGIWHVDGDFFVKYLDSPEQGLLIIPLWTDIVPGGGGTWLCPTSLKNVAQRLYDHPEGCSPGMTPRGQKSAFDLGTGGRLQWYNDLAASLPDSEFVEATGDVGDVYLLHPLMMHCASNNMWRNVRVITNPKVSMTEPFNFDRKEGDGEYSLVEKKTLKLLGKERLDGWKITTERTVIVSDRLKTQLELNRKAEMERQEATGLKGGEVKVETAEVVAIA